MEQYIDKSAVVAELEDWRDKIKKGIFSIPLHGNERAYATFEYEVLGKVLLFLDAFEVKEIQKKKLYVVTRCEEHSDYVEKAFFSEKKAEEYCKQFEGNEDAYGRDITEIEVDCPLEEKEVDLEREVVDYIEQHKRELSSGYFDIRRIARHFFVLGLNTQKGK